MSSSTRRRGRPKGSGLDDRALLRQIGALIEADPALRPTTAIKALGVTDPSTIRRLRDKLKSSDHKGGVSAVPAALGGGALSATALLQSRSRSSEQIEAQRPPMTAETEVAGLREISGPSSSSGDGPTGWLVNLYALGLSAFSSTVEAQISFFVEVLNVPHVESALRHQLLVNEAVAKALCPKRSDLRTLH